MTTPLPSWRPKNLKVPSKKISRAGPSHRHFLLVMYLPPLRQKMPMRMIQKPLSQQSQRLKVSLKLNLEQKSIQNRRQTLTLRLRVRLMPAQMPMLRLTLMPRSTLTLRLTPMLMLALRSRLTPMLNVDATLVLVPRQD